MSYAVGSFQHQLAIIDSSTNVQNSTGGLIQSPIRVAGTGTSNRIRVYNRASSDWAIFPDTESILKYDFDVADTNQAPLAVNLIFRACVLYGPEQLENTNSNTNSYLTRIANSRSLARNPSNASQAWEGEPSDEPDQHTCTAAISAGDRNPSDALSNSVAPDPADAQLLQQ